MKSRHLIALALTLVTCADVASVAAPSFAPTPSATMPPQRVADCVTYALVDNKCTADWYQCSADRKTCTRAWSDCCSLPGNPARTTIVTAPRNP
ncbi:MAG: hypothetical protein GC190_08195 [Alphaproteobacteria bacterium]|nr:hypothetical protein [Alphaproteobacteria bacterium]